MGEIAKGHHARAVVEVVDRRIDFIKVPVSAERGPARLVALRHKALPGNEPLVDDGQPGARGLSGAVKAEQIVWVRHGQALSVILGKTEGASSAIFPQLGYLDQRHRPRLSRQPQRWDGMVSTSNLTASLRRKAVIEIGDGKQREQKFEPEAGGVVGHLDTGAVEAGDGSDQAEA